jgi:hypothetical protein
VPGLPGAPVGDGDGPVVEQVAAERDLLATVVVLFGVVRLETDG